jgi:aldehyde:ferredoxin oxidoreductase
VVLNNQSFGKRGFFSVWRINMKERSFTREVVPVRWESLGGRGLLAKIIANEINPTCDPLGPNNKLIFAPGLLVGHMLSSCDRISIGGKSPLTGGIKESNAGGRTGLQLSHLGIKALIIEGKPIESGLWLLHISKSGVKFESASEFVGMGVYEVVPELMDRYGKKVAIALIGPGGEIGAFAAGIQNVDKDRVPSRIAARGGIGAVMGSKGVKAIVIDCSEGEKPPIYDISRFNRTKKIYTKAILEHPQSQVYKDYGTAAMTMMTQGFGALPTRNFSSGQFESADLLSGEFMRQSLLQRKGNCNTSHACMAGCVICSSNVYGDEDGEMIVSPLEYETIGLLGSNLGIDDLDIIARLNREVNDLGLDSIEIGGALGVSTEAGLMQFGDGERALELINEIRQGTPLGRTLAQGTAFVGKVFGIERIPVVKNQTISAYDPRAIKGTGVTYATSPQGADHTSGLTIRAKVDHLDPDGQAKLSINTQIIIAGYDSLGVCIFAGFGFNSVPTAISEFLNSRYGWDVGEEILRELGRDCLKLEREFNRGAGFTSAQDRVPEWMNHEPLSPHNAVFDVPEEDLDNLFDW